MTIMQRLTTPISGKDIDNNNTTTSATFAMTTEPEELDSKDPNMPKSPSHMDINACLVPDTIQVALLDRKREMIELVQHNKAFFIMIEHYLGPSNWPVFENLLYVTRQQLSDKQWVSNIGVFLKYNTPVFKTFKVLVGYVNDDDDDK